MRRLYSVETRSEKCLNKKNKKKSHVFQLHQVLSFALIWFLGALKKKSSHSTGHLHDEAAWKENETHLILHHLLILSLVEDWKAHWFSAKPSGLLSKAGRRSDRHHGVFLRTEMNWRNECTVKPQPCQSIQNLFAIYICLKCCLRNSHVTCKLLSLGISLHLNSCTNFYNN